MIGALYRHHVLSLVRGGRLVLVGAVGLACVALGAAVGVNSGSAAAHELVDIFGLTLLTPVTALVFGAAVYGDPIEDQTLVYLWLRPIARWKMIIAAEGAVLTLSLPFVLGPLAGAAALTGVGVDVVAGAVVAASVATIAYSSIFAGLSLVTRRTLVWGLLYILLWEGVVATIGGTPARASIRVYARSLLTDLANLPGSYPAASLGVAFAVPLVASGLVAGLASWWLSRMEV